VNLIQVLNFLKILKRHYLKTPETRFEHDTKTMKVTIRVGVLEKSILNLLINVKNTFKRQYCMSFLP